MKASFAALVAAALLGGTTCVLAASNVDLTVKGLITPSACTPSLSQGGMIDYGKIAAKDLRPTGWTDLPKVSLQMAVNCEATTMFALRPVDNRPERPQPVNLDLYGLGVVNGNELAGAYFLDIFQAQADGTAVSAYTSPDNGESWQIIPVNAPWTPGSFTGFGHGGPVPIKDLTFELQVWSIISPADWLTLDREVPLDGSTTLELKYL